MDQADRKRFTRLKRIVVSFKEQIQNGIPSYNVISAFEDFYKENKKSVAKLADVYVKSLKK